MNVLTAVRLDRDRDLTADIVPEVYFKCPVLRELNFPWADKTFERQFTEVRGAYTEKFLYLHLWAKDSWIAAQETKAKGRVYQDDCLEVFLMPTSGKYWVWEVNALGTVLDYKVEGWGEGPVEDRHMDLKWKTSAQIRARKHNAGWVLELKIPFAKEFGAAPRRGDTWGAAFNRLDLDRQGRQTLSTSSGLAPDSPVWFHQPWSFGQILFG